MEATKTAVAAFVCGAAVGAASTYIATRHLLPTRPQREEHTQKQQLQQQEGESVLLSDTGELTDKEPTDKASAEGEEMAAASPIPAAGDTQPPEVSSDTTHESGGHAANGQEGDVPDNANENCPGTASDSAGKSAACAGCPNQAVCASGEARKPDPAISEVHDKLKSVKHKILVLSGKGGVGKSTVSAQLAYALAGRSHEVGLLDIDICGPSIPRLLGLSGQEVHSSAAGWSPVYVDENLAVMSIGFLLPNQDDAVIWRGPRKNGLIKQFLTDVAWGDLDFLIVDTPPGTSDEHLSIVTYLKEAQVDGAVIVTTPQEVAMADVRKEINFCKKVGVPILGVVENMADSIFQSPLGGPKIMCEKMSVPYAGSIPLDQQVMLAGELGKSLRKTDSQLTHTNTPPTTTLANGARV